MLQENLDSLQFISLAWRHNFEVDSFGANNIGERKVDSLLQHTFVGVKEQFTRFDNNIHQFWRAVETK